MMASSFKPISDEKCDRCGEPIDVQPGETYMASTDGKVWHLGCSRRARPSPSPVTDELLPCRECGSECRVETFGNTELIAKPFDLFVCANHQRFGGNCPSDLAYFSAENWNERPSVTDDGLVERLAADIMIALRRAKLDRGSDEAQDEFEALTLVPMIRAALAASDRDVLVSLLCRARDVIRKTGGGDAMLNDIDEALTGGG